MTRTTRWKIESLEPNRFVFYLVAQIDSVGETPLRDVLDSLGGWPVVTQGWSEDEWNFEATVGKLRGLYNAPILIDSWVAADDKNSTVHILQVVITTIQ